MAESLERQQVEVEFVSDENVENSVKTIGIKPKKKLAKSHGILKSIANDPVEENGVEIEQRQPKNINSLYSEIKDNENIVFAFQTPKQSKKVNNYATQIVKKNHLLKSNRKTNDTPSEYVDKYSFNRLNAIGHDESSQSDFSDADDDENKDIEESSENDRGGFNLPSSTELYFEANKGDRLKTTTSNKTLSKLKSKQMDREKMVKILNTHDTKKNKSGKIEQDVTDEENVKIACLQLCQGHCKYFKKWMYSMLHGYNMLLYGVGSKRDIMKKFADEFLKPFSKLFINGFFPSITIKNVLVSISEDVLSVPWTYGNNTENAIMKICEYYNNDDNDPLFLFVNNIEGSGLRNSNAQSTLSRLSNCKNIHLIASIDHINSVLMWDQTKLHEFKWLWHNVTTFLPYTLETSYENSLLLLTSGGAASGSLALSGLLHVARSLTPNARGIFKILAEYQLEECKDNASSYNGYLFSELYQHCREAFLVNSELTLRTQLTEFLDHKLVQIKKGIDGGEYLTIPLDVGTLQEYLEHKF